MNMNNQANKPLSVAHYAGAIPARLRLNGPGPESVCLSACLSSWPSWGENNGPFENNEKRGRPLCHLLAQLTARHCLPPDGHDTAPAAGVAFSFLLVRRMAGCLHITSCSRLGKCLSVHLPGQAKSDWLHNCLIVMLQSCIQSHRTDVCFRQSKVSCNEIRRVCNTTYNWLLAYLVTWQ